jgi:hypothetical protein
MTTQGEATVVDYTRRGETRLKVPKASKEGASEGKEKGKKRKDMNDATQGANATMLQAKYTPYPVTPPENWALEQFEFWDILLREKLYKHFLGGTTPTHPTNNNNNMFVSNRAPKNWFQFVLFLYTGISMLSLLCTKRNAKVFLQHTRLVQSP